MNANAQVSQTEARATQPPALQATERAQDMIVALLQRLVVTGYRPVITRA